MLEKGKNKFIEKVKQLTTRFLLLGLIVLMGCEIKAVNDELDSSPNTNKPYGQEFSNSKAHTQHGFINDSSKKYIYLSFDDGPQHGTLETFAICRDNGIKATYFMIGLHTISRKDGREIVLKIKNSYPQFLLANHSFSHASGHYTDFYKHSGRSLLDFLRTQDTLKPPFKIIRLPGNNAWVLKDTMHASGLVRSVCKLLDSTGYNIIGWDTEWTFNHKTALPAQSAELMASQIIHLLEKNETFTKNHLVLLTHDRIFHRQQDLDSLNKMIGILKKQPNFVFETIDHYPGLKR